MSNFGENLGLRRKSRTSAKISDFGENLGFQRKSLTSAKISDFGENLGFRRKSSEISSTGLTAVRVLADREHLCLYGENGRFRDSKKCLPKNSLGVRTADSLSGKGITAPQRRRRFREVFAKTF